MPGNEKNSLLPGRTGIASSLLGLLFMFSQGHHGQSNSTGSGLSCPTEVIFCLADAGCSSCIETLQAFASSSIAATSNFEECTEAYDTLCGFADTNGCDMTNTVLLDLAACLAEEEYGCVGFEGCNPDVLNTTPAPTTVGATTIGATSEPTAGATTIGASSEPTAGGTSTADFSSAVPITGATSAPTAGTRDTADFSSVMPTPASTVIGTPIATASDPLEAGSSTSGAFRSSPATHTHTALGMVVPTAVVVAAVCFAV